MINIVRNDQKENPVNTCAETDYRFATGFLPQNLPGGPVVLDELSQLNLAWLQAFTGPRASALGSPLAALLAGLQVREQAAIASCPFALFCLPDPVTDHVHDAGHGLQGDDLALTVSLYAFAWCLVRIDVRAAKLLLGLKPVLCQRLAVTPMAQLQRGVRSLQRIPDASLGGHRVYWEELVAAVRGGDGDRQRVVQMRGLQLLAAPVIESPAMYR